MTRSEALQVLGLSDTAEKQDIIKAHRKLMQKVHPDHGGSDYLAAKINQAKDFLLKA
nr:DnaJ domain-containing protein [Pseudomaricurvus alcaniphilus]